MRNMGIFHPDFFYHPRPVVESAMITDVKIYSPDGTQSDWVPGQTASENSLYTLRYIGKARVQPNKDWRARVREQGLEFGATQAVRVQVGIESNLYYAVDGEPASGLHADASEDFKKDWMVIVDQSYVDGAEYLEDSILYVRNALGSGNKWLHNLLCDTNTKE